MMPINKMTEYYRDVVEDDFKALGRYALGYTPMRRRYGAQEQVGPVLSLGERAFELQELMEERDA